MSIRSACLLAAALLVPQAAAQAGQTAERALKTATLQSGQTVTLQSGRGAAATLTISQPEAPPVSAELDRDQTVAPSAPVLAFAVIGEIGSRTVLLTDSYPSLPGDLSYCRAGEEQFLRVLAVVEHRLRETLRLKLASCRENVELASDGLRWTPDGATLSIHWLSAPGSDQQQATRVYKIDPSGAPTLLTQQ